MDDDGQMLRVGLLGDKVLLEITCPDHYAAILLYEQIVKAAAAGEAILQLELEPKP